MPTPSCVLWYYLRTKCTNWQLSCMSSDKTGLLNFECVYLFIFGNGHKQSLPEGSEMRTSTSPTWASFFSCLPPIHSLAGTSEIICSTAENAL